jgi:hypothetical protein
MMNIIIVDFGKTPTKSPPELTPQPQTWYSSIDRGQSDKPMR